MNPMQACTANLAMDHLNLYLSHMETEGKVGYLLCARAEIPLNVLPTRLPSLVISRSNRHFFGQS